MAGMLADPRRAEGRTVPRANATTLGNAAGLTTGRSRSCGWSPGPAQPCDRRPTPPERQDRRPPRLAHPDQDRCAHPYRSCQRGSPTRPPRRAARVTEPERHVGLLPDVPAPHCDHAEVLQHHHIEWTTTVPSTRSNADSPAPDISSTSRQKSDEFLAQMASRAK